MPRKLTRCELNYCSGAYNCTCAIVLERPVGEESALFKFPQGVVESLDACIAICCPPCLANQTAMSYSEASAFYGRGGWNRTAYYKVELAAYPACPLQCVFINSTASPAFTDSTCDAHYHYKIIQVAEFMVAI